MDHTDKDWEKLCKRNSELTQENIYLQECVNKELEYSGQLYDEIIRLTKVSPVALILSFLSAFIVSWLELRFAVHTISFGTVLAVVWSGWFCSIVCYWGYLIHIDEKRKKNAIKKG